MHVPNASKPVLALGLAAALNLAASAALSAAPPPPGPPIYEFGEIIVTGKQPRVVDRVTTVDIVTAEQIERAGARTLDEAIALLPGVNVRLGAEGVPLVDIRGLRTRNVLLLLDGVPLNSSFDGLFDPATLSVENVARIKLTRGASSVLYGPGGNAGVLNIVTRAAGEAIDGSLRLEGSSSESSELRGLASLRRGDLGLVVSGSLFDQQHFDLSGDFRPTPLEDGGERLNSDREDGSAFAGLTFDLAEGSRLGVNVNYRSVERGKPPVTEDFRLSPFAPRARFERTEQQAVSAHASLSHDLGNGWSLRPALYVNQADALTDAFDDGTYSTQDRAGAFREDASTSILGASLQVALARSSRGLATLAIDFREARWSATGFSVPGGGGVGGGGGGAGGGGGGGGGGSRLPFDEDRSVDVASLALEYELAPDGPFSAVVGAGYAAQSREGAATDENVNFLLGGTWTFRPAATLRASMAHQIRFPTLRDLYGLDRGNPDLDAERTLNYEIGVERDARGHYLALALFRIDADDFIQRTPNDVLRNEQRTRFQGVELEGRHRLPKALRLAWSFTWLDAENRSRDAGRTRIQNVPEHKVALTAERDLRIGLRLRADLHFQAGRYALSRTLPVQATELGDFTLVGLKLSQPLAAGRLRLLARVANLLDEDYVDSIGFPAPGRKLVVGLELRGGAARTS